MYLVQRIPKNGTEQTLLLCLIICALSAILIRHGPLDGLNFKASLICSYFKVDAEF